MDSWSRLLWGCEVTFSLQGQGFGRLIVCEQVAESSPSDESVKRLLVVLLRHVQNDRFQQKNAINCMARLPLQGLMHIAEQAQLQQLLAPDGLAFLRASLDESQPLGFQDHKPARRIHEIEQFGCLDDIDDAPKIAVGVGSDSEQV